MKSDAHATVLRIPQDLWLTYKKAALYSRKSMNYVICEALESRKTFVEKKYIPDVDKSK